MIHRKTERGQALILIALAVVGLFTFAALAIDGTRVYSDKRHAQNAADTSVLAAALAKVRGGSDAQVEQAARDRATSNGYSNDTIPVNSGTPNTKVVVALCSAENTIDPVTNLLMPACQGLPSGANKSEYIRVWIVSTIPSTFGRVIGRSTFTTGVEAIAHVQGGTSGTGGPGFAGAAMVATNSTNESHCFLFNGNATLVTHNSGVYINCTASDSFFLNGSTVYTMGADSYVAGCFSGNAGYHYSGGAIHCGAPQVIVDDDTYDYVPTMPAVPACGGKPADPTGSGFGWSSTATSGAITVNNGGTATISPGTYSEIIVNNNATLIMKPGVYCPGTFNLNGNTTTLTGLAGTVTVVLSGDFNLNNGGNNCTFDSLELFSTNASLNLGGGKLTTANALRFYSSGAGSVKINSTSTLKSNDSYFYLAQGGLVWNGSTNVELRAPTYDPYNGILLHAPYENKTNIDLNGGSSAQLYGTFLAPGSQITYNGGTNFVLHGQVIAYDYKLDGDGNIEIFYVSSPAIGGPPPSPAVIESTK